MPGASGNAFRAILAAAVLMRLLLVIAVPFGGEVAHHLEGLGDEPAHLNYVAYLVEHRTFPVQTRHAFEPGSYERADFEFYQPPLYYLLCAPFYALLGMPAALWASRLVSFLCGLLSLLLLNKILERMGLADSRRRLAVAFLALLPSHAYFSAVVSNDSLAWLIGFLLTERLFTLFDRSLTPDAIRRPGLHVVIGCLLGLGMLAKPSMAIFYPVVAFAYAYAYRRTRRAATLGWAFLALGTSLVLAGPWHLRNVALYGSPFALHVGFGPPHEGSVLDHLVHAVRATARYFWFPMQVPPSGMLSVVRVIGGLILVVHAVAAIGYLWRGVTEKTGTLALLLLLALASQLGVGLLWMAAEGRYIFSALAAIVFFLVVPAADLLRRWGWGERALWVYFCALALHPYLLLMLVQG